MQPIEELKNSGDQYRVVSVCTGHLPYRDVKKLTTLANDPTKSRVMANETSFFVKIRGIPKEEDSFRELFPRLDKSSYQVLMAAQEAGFAMVEFDPDATVYDCFTWYNW